MGTAIGALFALAPLPALADSIPLPSTDFSLEGKMRQAGLARIAHSGGKLRVELYNPSSQAPMVGIIDLKAGKMLMTIPKAPKMAVEIELPQDYSFGAISGSGLRVGTDTVAGEPCDLWKIEAQVNIATAPTTACITTDGIALRAEVEVQGRKQIAFEATQLTRGPQDPKLFVLPEGVQVLKVPKGAAGLPGVPALTR